VAAGWKRKAEDNATQTLLFLPLITWACQDERALAVTATTSASAPENQWCNFILVLLTINWRLSIQGANNGIN